MIDINLIRNNPKIVEDNLKKKDQNNKLPLVKEIKTLDEEWRKIKQKADDLRHKRNEISLKINKLMKEKSSVKKEIEQAKSIPKKIETLEKKQNKLKEKIDSLILQIPNMMHPSVPKGKDESENVEIKKNGKIPKFNFPIKNHVQLAESLGIADFDASSKVSGNGFYYLKKELALLNQALIRYTIDTLYKKGYEYIETPLMLKEKEIFASMDKKAIEDSVYSIKGEDLHLIGTSEQSLLAMHANNSIPESELPKKYFSYSMCFRKEIGAHGINEKGIWRTHQFNKVEQFIFCMPQDSEKLYDELLQNSEEIVKGLEIPYRIIEMCTGDLADWKYRSADLEIWRPTTNSYGEAGSLSNCTSYQARKLGIRYADKKGNRDILHTLNNTAIATSRILVAILENNQQKDGSIKIPKVLVPYMNGIKEIKKH